MIKLKTWPEFFDDLYIEKMNFSVRKNDRDFKVGQELVLEEYQPNDYNDHSAGGEYSGKVCLRKIIYVLPGGQFGIEEGYVVLGLAKL